MEKIKILLADDHPIYIEGLTNLLNTYNYEIVAAAKNGAEAVQMAAELQPDIVLMDADMPVLNGIEATKEIKLRCPEIKILILTGLDDEKMLFGAVEAGASGFLTKDLDGDYLNKSLQDLLSGVNPFSPGKQECLLKEFAKRSSGEEEPETLPELSDKSRFILGRICKGATYKEIAYDLCISERAVKYHVRKIKDLYKINSQIELLAFYEKVK